MNAAPFTLRLLICVAYLGMGLFVLVKRPLQAAVYDVPFAIACIAYGAFRAYRAYSQYREENGEA